MHILYVYIYIYIYIYKGFCEPSVSRKTTVCHLTQWNITFSTSMMQGKLSKIIIKYEEKFSLNVTHTLGCPVSHVPSRFCYYHLCAKFIESAPQISTFQGNSNTTLLLKS